jgi:hypothetical protein
MKRLTAGALFLVLSTSIAPAITAEVAKKCNAAVAKAFPPRVPGNPAAGSAKGSGSDQAAFWKKCVENGGEVPTKSDAAK